MASAPASAITIKYCCQSRRGRGEGGVGVIATAKGQPVSFDQGMGSGGVCFPTTKQVWLQKVQRFRRAFFSGQSPDTQKHGHLTLFIDNTHGHLTLFIDNTHGRLMLFIDNNVFLLWF